MNKETFMNIDGLLLCSECENQLTVHPYRGNHGFFIVEPCHHCKSAQQVIQAEHLPDGLCEHGFASSCPENSNQGALVSA